MKGYSMPHPMLARVRDIALPVAAVGVAATLPFHLLVHAFIVLGQAHFALTYLYQWKGGRMTAGYRIAALLLAVLAALYFIYIGQALLLMVPITILFSFHFALDEFTLHDEAISRGGIVSVAGFTLSFFLISMLFLAPGANAFALAALAVALGAIGARFLIERTPPKKAEWYLWLVQALVFLVAVPFGLPGNVLAVIVILHVLNWYAGYGARVASNASRAKRYWRDVTLSLLATLALFIAYRALAAPLSFLFALGPYYAWATAHIVLSLVASRTRAT